MSNLSRFNSDFPFYFRQRGLEIQANEADFEFVVCHEITHGLGFESGWVDYNSLFNNKIPKGVLAPIPFYSGPSSARFVGFSPLLVMDQYIDGSRISLAEIEQNIRKFQCHNCSASKFVETFQAHSFTMEAASLAYEQATLHSTFASQVQLHTPAVFQQGSSLAHLDTQFDNSSDFLMTWSISSRIGSTLDEVVGTGGIFGGNTLLILKKMGWSTPDSPNTTPVTISLKYTNFSYSSKLSLLWIIVMIATIV